jgi:hypothetical protein
VPSRDSRACPPLRSDEGMATEAFAGGGRAKVWLHLWLVLSNRSAPSRASAGLVWISRDRVTSPEGPLTRPKTVIHDTRFGDLLWAACVERVQGMSRDLRLSLLRFCSRGWSRVLWSALPSHAPANHRGMNEMMTVYLVIYPGIA